MNFGPFLPFCILSCGEARRRVGRVPWWSAFGMISAIVRLRPRRWEDGVWRERHANQKVLCQEGKEKKGQRVQVVMKCDCGKVVAASVLVLECWVLAGSGELVGFLGISRPVAGVQPWTSPTRGRNLGKREPSPAIAQLVGGTRSPVPEEVLSLNLNPIQSRDVYCAKVTGSLFEA